MSADDALTVYLISRYYCLFLYREECVVSPLEEVTDRVVGAGGQDGTGDWSSK